MTSTINAEIITENANKQPACIAASSCSSNLCTRRMYIHIYVQTWINTRWYTGGIGVICFPTTTEVGGQCGGGGEECDAETPRVFAKSSFVRFCFVRRPLETPPPSPGGSCSRAECNYCCSSDTHGVVGKTFPIFRETGVWRQRHSLRRGSDEGDILICFPLLGCRTRFRHSRVE